MKLKNNITGKYQALPEEMLCKWQVLFVKQPISLPFIYLNFWKGTPFPIKAIIGSTPPPPVRLFWGILHIKKQKLHVLIKSIFIHKLFINIDMYHLKKLAIPKFSRKLGRVSSFN